MLCSTQWLSKPISAHLTTSFLKWVRLKNLYSQTNSGKSFYWPTATCLRTWKSATNCMSLNEPLSILHAPFCGWELSRAADSDGEIATSSSCVGLGVLARRQTDSQLSPGFAELFAPGELMIIFLICSKRERKAIPCVVVSPLGPTKCPMSPAPIAFSRCSTIYKWRCLLHHETCLNLVFSSLSLY